MDRNTDGRRLESYPISSPLAQVSYKDRRRPNPHDSRSIALSVSPNVVHVNDFSHCSVSARRIISVVDIRTAKAELFMMLLIIEC